MLGKLYLVSTPIGNLDDITFRALKVLRETRFILAEDTRSTTKLMHYYDIPTRDKTIFSFFEGNEDIREGEAIAKLHSGHDVTIVSESGTPLISDPGFKLVREAINKQIPVISVPGPTALISALTSSGLPPNAFIFLGFLPKGHHKKRQILQKAGKALQEIDQLKTIILYESPHRVITTLQLLKDLFGQVPVCLARELTKIHEEIIRADVESAINYFQENKPRGEFVILFSLNGNWQLETGN